MCYQVKLKTYTNDVDAKGIRVPIGYFVFCRGEAAGKKTYGCTGRGSVG
jgi:hypothetical protein